MSTELYTLIAVLANLALTILKEVRRSKCSVGWGFCSCATVNRSSKSEVASPVSKSPQGVVPSEYRVPVDGPDLDKVTLHAETKQDQQIGRGYAY